MNLRLPKIEGYHPDKGVQTGSLDSFIFSEIKVRKTWQDFARDDCGFSAEMAAHHVAAWEWIAALESGKPSEPLVLCLARGGGKTSTMCGGIAYVGECGSRTFALYVSATQKQANQHLQEIATQMSDMGMERKTNQYGVSQGWNATMLRVSNDFNVVALGLDSAARGIKLDQLRPDWIVLDDIDELTDSPDVTASKIETITNSILPSMAPHGCVSFVQNVIHSDSIMASFVDRKNEFLLGASVFGPYPAAYNLVTERAGDTIKVVGGEPTWAGQSLAVIEHQINTYGLRAFMRESQHEVDVSDGAFWTKEMIESCHVMASQVPGIERYAIGFDPAVSTGDKSDLTGIVAAGLGFDGIVYVFCDRTDRMSAGEAVSRAYDMYAHFNAECVVYETNQGGHFVAEAFLNQDPTIRLEAVRAHLGKAVVARPVAALYEDGRVKHVLYPDGAGFVNDCAKLEKQMLKWTGKQNEKSPDSIDAAVMVISYLMRGSNYGDAIVKQPYRG